VINKSFFFAGLVALSLTSACANDDTVVETSDSIDVGGKADAFDSQSTYYAFARDTRRCVSPLCGGYWVAKVNADGTVCADGRKAAECYVAELDLADSGLTEIPGDQGLLRGKLGKKGFGTFGKLGTFSATELWTAGAALTPSEGFIALPAGDFVKVTLSGVRCKTTPCPFFSEIKLNSGKQKNLAELDLESVGLDEKAYEAAQTALTSEGLIVAAKHTNVVGPGGSMVGRKASQTYVRATAPVAECFKTGCSGTVCADETVFTTCQFEPWMACYADAVCERQSDGGCGFTASPIVDTCLADLTPAE
jgi:hypothetical protein